MVLVIVGVVLAGLGALGVVNSFMTRTTAAMSIPAGAEWYVYFEFDVLGGGSLHVEYLATTGTVDVFALTETQYAKYVNNGSTEALYSATGMAAGTFDVTLPGSGRYYVTFDHGQTSETVAQEVRTTIRLLGIDPAWLLGGLLLLGIGLAMAGLGWRGKRKAMRVRVPTPPAPPPVPPPADVTVGPDRKPPEPPAPPPPPESPGPPAPPPAGPGISEGALGDRITGSAVRGGRVGRSRPRRGGRPGGRGRIRP
ncbi:MAG TPA: hypothetical protein VFA17_04575 [Thermoplasmata archaeon]|nr:hypothetical protein [Thermoplasmata archaeon]